MSTITIDTIVARWTNPTSRPLFKGALISDDGCRCAQGDILHLAGWSDDQLRSTKQWRADCAVADILGISRAYAVLLRNVNDCADGCPQNVLTAPQLVLGEHAPLVLAFWRHLDGMTDGDWEGAKTARTAAWAAARTAAADAAADAAGDAAADAARTAAWAATWDAAGDAARATAEIQGHILLAERGRDLFFLPMFGLTIDRLRELAGDAP